MTDELGIGRQVRGVDAVAKACGQFTYAGDLHVPGMLWAATVRSPHPHAVIRSIDTKPASAVPGVRAVLTHADIPGRNRYGQVVADQPVLAEDVVRFHGEPIAIVAAETPDAACAAADAVVVAFDVMPASTSLRAIADAREESRVLRHVPIRKGHWRPGEQSVVVAGEYETGTQDPAFLGPEAGLAIPRANGVTLHVATQHVHADQAAVASILGIPVEGVDVRLAGVAGAFGGREDLTLQAHIALLASATGRPVFAEYDRAESFLAHGHRHPALLRYTHACDPDGALTHVRAEIWLDGGAYATSSPTLVAYAATMAVGPYDVPNVHVDAYVVTTNNPPNGAMRGFGAVQTCFAYESQMDAVAERMGSDPIAFRVRNRIRTGCSTATGQVVDAPAELDQLLHAVREHPMPDAPGGGVRSSLQGPGGFRRGVGYALGMKGLGFGGGFDDLSEAEVDVVASGGVVRAVVRCAAADVGQGVGTVFAQIVRQELPVSDVEVVPPTSAMGQAGSSSASRQTYVSGGAVREAARSAARELARRCAEHAGVDRSAVTLGQDGFAVAGRTVPLSVVLAEGAASGRAAFRPRSTTGLDPTTGAGDFHVQLAFAAHRVVVDVDVDLGLVKVVDVVCAQDVGRVVNPAGVAGQIQGATAQGVGLAVSEEIALDDGRVLTSGWGDYLIPAIGDVPGIDVVIFEFPDARAPYGVRGAGEPAAVSAGPATVAAIRRAVGSALNRMPVRAEDVVAGRLSP